MNTVYVFWGDYTHEMVDFGTLNSSGSNFQEILGQYVPLESERNIPNHLGETAERTGTRTEVQVSRPRKCGPWFAILAIIKENPQSVPTTFWCGRYRIGGFPTIMAGCQSQQSWLGDVLRI
jgi:hypothetical protein